MSELFRRPPSDLIAGWQFNHGDFRGFGHAGATATEESGTVTLGDGFIDLSAGTEHLNCGNNSRFNFGTSAFSIDAWVSMDDATNFRIITKISTGTTASNWEWAFYTNPSDKLGLTCYNGSTGAYIGRTTSGTVTSYQATIAHFCATFAGGTSDTGIKIYIDGVEQSTSAASTGIYTGMPTTTEDVRIGRLYVTYAHGKIYAVRVWDGELSAARVATLFNIGER